MIHYTYIVCCADQTLYTGYTTSIDRRLHAHNSGRGAKYTRNRRPVHLVYWQAFDNMHDAMSREWHIKQLSRPQKLQLISSCSLLPAPSLKFSEFSEKISTL